MSAWGAVRRLGANLGVAARRGLAWASLPSDGAVWLAVRLTAPVEELVAPQLAFGRPVRLALLDVLATLEAAADDPRVAGVVLRFTGRVGGLSRALSLRRAVDALRERGKPVVAFAETFEAESFVVASGATRVYLPESGQLLLVGLRLESLHFKHLLDRVGVKPEILRVGSHKSAGERFTRARLSPEDREQLEALADDLFEALIAAIAAGRQLEPGAVVERVDAGPYAAAAALEAGLIDGCRYPDEVEAELPDLAPGTARSPRDGRPRVVDAASYHALCVAGRDWRPLLSDLPHVAYVVARGAIHRGRGVRGIAAESLRELLERVKRDEAVRAVVLRLDSPGGEAVASDLIWRAVTLLRREKPVVVSMGDVTASGGYYIAAAADAVFAEAGSVTGSIGVVGGKADLAGLYEKLGVSRDGVERGARAGLLADTRGFTPDERSAYRALLESLHATFADRVAQGRGLAPEDVAPLATGRVWSGSRAVGLHLVDTLGGPLEALRDARTRAGLDPCDRYLLQQHPRLPPLPSWFPLLARAGGRPHW